MTELLADPTDVTGPPQADGPGPSAAASAVGTLRWAWRTLITMRTALVLLLLLALASVPGSLLPQRGTAPGDVVRFERDNPTLAPVLDRLYLFEVFSAPWFAAIYLLLLVAMTGCVLPRSRRLWRAARAEPAAAPSNWNRLDAQVQGRHRLDAEQVLERAEAALRRRGFRVRPARTSEAGTISAEKGYLREVGNLVFHSSLLLLLYGVAFGHLYGFEGRVIVVEGAGFSNVRAQYDEFKGGPRVDPDRLEPFAFTLQDFRSSFERDGPNLGQPRYFAADITVTTGQRQEQMTLEVNQPLKVNGTKAFLTGHGYAPVFTVRDGDGDIAFQGPVVFLPRDGSFASEGVIKAPDAAPTQLAFEGFFLPTAATGPQGPMSAFPAADNPQALLTAFTGDLNLGNGVPQSVYTLDKSLLRQVEVDGAPLARALEVGQTMTLPGGDGSVTFDGVQQFANFQLAHDPGRQTSLLAAVLLLTGLTGSLLIRQRRVFVRVTPGADGAKVVVAGSARTRRGLPDGELDEIADALGLVPDESPTAHRTSAEPDDTRGGQRA